ncbi:MAG TPA: sulfatase [Rhodothermales bacterium]|nr:sulfatase [Rhodothermales bacterium]
MPCPPQLKVFFQRWLVAFVVGLCMLLGCESQPGDESAVAPWGARPNIVWLVAEDLSPVIPPFGDSTITTPTLSRLTAEGVRYTHVFSPSGVCAPSRAALATGMYPTAIGAQHMRTGPWWAGAAPPEVLASAQAQMPPGVVPYEALAPPPVRMLSEYLRQAGYYTSNNRKEDYQFIKPVTAWDDSSPQAHWRNRAPGQPFFAVFNFEVTHESRIWSKGDDPLLVPDTLKVPVPPYLPDTEVVRRDLRRMYSNIKEMDAQVGEVLRQLETDGLLDSTIVFWFTDHGGPMPRQKRTLYDSGLRVPLIIRFPSQEHANTIDDQLMSFVDFLPTVLSLANVDPPDHLHGRAFLGSYAADTTRPFIHAAADRFDEHYDTIRAVRDHRFKYLRNLRPEQGYYLPVAYREQMATMQTLLRLRATGTLDQQEALWFRSEKAAEELFDTQTDPHELHNLADDPAYAEELSTLRAEYDRWATAIPDFGLMPEPAYLASIWPEGVQPTTEPPTAAWQGNTLYLSSTTEGASIGYQILNGDAVPGPRWEVYTAPLPLEPDVRIVALAHRIGYCPSDPVFLAPDAAR